MFEDFMTKEMLDCLIPSEVLITEVKMCTHCARTAAAAGNIKLPAAAASGAPVVHGARTAMKEIQSYWTHRASLALNMLSPAERKIALEE